MPETHHHRTVTAGAGRTAAARGVPRGAVAVPVTERLAGPPPTASNSTAAEQAGAGDAGRIAGPHDRDVDAAGGGVDLLRERRRARRRRA